ncbi:transposase [Azospirillaceae bacterium]
MRFLNPKTDFAFKKIFGSDSSRDILISFLNAILDFSGERAIVDVAILDPYQAPRIKGWKDSFVDVRAKDQRGRSFIVEMQVLNLEGFEKRVFYNACKAYVGQLDKDDEYVKLVEVVAVTITDFILFPELERTISRFRMSAEEKPSVVRGEMELVFAELPKFLKSSSELKTVAEMWLYFLKHAEDLSVVPETLAIEPAIAHAFEKANKASWTAEELDAQENREMWIASHRITVEKAEAKGEAKGKANMLTRQLIRRYKTIPPPIAERIQNATSEQLDNWMDQLMDATSLDDIFGPPQSH